MLRVLDEATVQYLHESPNRVRARAERYLVVLKKHRDVRINASRMSQLCRDIGSVVSDPNVREIFRLELRAMAGMLWDLPSLVRHSCTLAGGYNLARSGKSIGILANSWPETDCLLRVKRIVLQSQEVRTVSITFVVCNTRYAGLLIKEEFPSDRTGAWVRRFGAINFKKKLVNIHMQQLFNMHCIGRLFTSNGLDTLAGICCPKQWRDLNRRLLTSRFRSCVLCPYGADFDCEICDVGINQCVRSCLATNTNFDLELVT